MLRIISETTKHNLKIGAIAIAIGGAFFLGYNAKEPVLEIKVVENTCISRLLEGQTVYGYKLIEKKGLRHPYLKRVEETEKTRKERRIRKKEE